MGNGKLLHKLIADRNELSSNKDQLEVWDILDEISDVDEAIKWLEKDIAQKKKDRQYFRLYHDEMRIFENMTVDDVFTRLLPIMENGGEDQDMKIVIGDRTMYIPLNARTYETLINAMKECYRIENE